MGRLRLKASLMARTIFPNRNWFPIEAWDDGRYGETFPQMRAQADELEAQRVAARDVQGPTFSIVVPLYKTPADYLDDMVQSVLAQTYPRWELVLVNASPELDDLAHQAADYAAADSRIQVVTLEGNLGITENTNRGIAAATGDFTSFMDHDDWLEPDTLFEYAAALRGRDDIDVMYCDEDMVERAGASWRFFHPLFKPDYSPELLICKNYVLHLLTVRTSLLAKLPKPGSEYDGAQDYNLTMRAFEQARSVCHVPKVLYHWRISEQSTATNSDAKPYGKRAYRLSVDEHLKRVGPAGSLVTAGVVNNFNVWFHAGRDARVSLVVARGHEAAGDTFATFVDAFYQVNTYDNVELLLADNREPELSRVHGMRDNMRHVQTPPEASLLERFNAGAGQATGDYLVFLDTSCVFLSPEPIEQLVGMLNRPDMGVVAPKTLYSNLTVKSYGVGVSEAGIVPLYRGYALDYPSYQCNTRTFLNATAVGMQGLSVSRDLFARLGGFDTGYSGEMGAVALCGKAAECGRRTVATCTVQLLTTERPCAQPFDERAERPDYPAAETATLFEQHPDMRKPYDPYRGPHLVQASSYPIIDYAVR